MAVAGTPAAAAETEETERKRTATGAGTGGATGCTTGGWGRTTGLSPTRRPSPPGVPVPLLLPQVWKLLLWLQKYDIWFLGVRCGVEGASCWPEVLSHAYCTWYLCSLFV